MGGDNGVRGVFIVEGSNSEEKQRRNAWQANCSLARIEATFRRQCYPKSSQVHACAGKCGILYLGVSIVDLSLCRERYEVREMVELQAFDV